MYGGKMLKFVFLTGEFYIDDKDCSEIEKKENRPYTMILATINNIDFSISLRSNMKHKNALLTDTVNKCGLDFSKAVVINDKDQHIDGNRKPKERESLRLLKYKKGK